MNHLDRREFLQFLLQALAVSSVGVGGPMTAGGETMPRDGGTAGGVLPNVDAAINIGNQYLKRHPDSGPLQVFSHEVFGGDTASNEERRRTIAERVKNDFISDNVVTVMGWRLARSEAMLCALVTLELDRAG